MVSTLLRLVKLVLNTVGCHPSSQSVAKICQMLNKRKIKHDVIFIKTNYTKK